MSELVLAPFLDVFDLGEHSQGLSFDSVQQTCHELAVRFLSLDVIDKGLALFLKSFQIISESQENLFKEINSFESEFVIQILRDGTLFHLQLNHFWWFELSTIHGLESYY